MEKRKVKFEMFNLSQICSEQNVDFFVGDDSQFCIFPALKNCKVSFQIQNHSMSANNICVKNYSTVPLSVVVV